jgi:endogenous inhibitor of DNA gyrase (YacG/DUF329 family)
MTEDSEKGGRKTAGKPASKIGGKCPVCSKPVEPRYRPFCSQRCQQIDLGRWLSETYRIAADQDPASSASEPDEE